MDGGPRLGGSVALVTGGGSGIGRAIALRYASEGADLALADLNLAATENVAHEVEALGRTARAYRVDVSAVDECRALSERAAADFGHLDVLVNCAGVAHASNML